MVRVLSAALYWVDDSAVEEVAETAAERSFLAVEPSSMLVNLRSLPPPFAFQSRNEREAASAMAISARMTIAAMKPPPGPSSPSERACVPPSLRLTPVPGGARARGATRAAEGASGWGAATGRAIARCPVAWRGEEEAAAAEGARAEEEARRRCRWLHS